MFSPTKSGGMDNIGNEPTGTTQTLENCGWETMKFSSSEGNFIADLDASGVGNMASSNGGPNNTTQGLDTDTPWSHFPDIADVGDGNWNPAALAIVLLLKTDPQPTWNWVPRHNNMRSFLTLERLNVWFSIRCGIKEPRTSEDIEEAWQWIKTDHEPWANYFLQRPNGADRGRALRRGGIQNRELCG